MAKRRLETSPGRGFRAAFDGFLDQYGIFLLLGLLILAPNLLTPIFRSITEALYGLVGLPVG